MGLGFAWTLPCGADAGAAGAPDGAGNDPAAAGIGTPRFSDCGTGRGAADNPLWVCADAAGTGACEGTGFGAGTDNAGDGTEDAPVPESPGVAVVAPGDALNLGGGAPAELPKRVGALAVPPKPVPADWGGVAVGGAPRPPLTVG